MHPIHLFSQHAEHQRIGLYSPTASKATQHNPVSAAINALLALGVCQAQAATDEIETTIAPLATEDSSGSDTERSANASGGSGHVNSLMGAYSYTYPITVPPGRGGFAPQLALNYNSLNPNSWLGEGWSLSLANIQRSTKNGKPAYNDQDTFIIFIKESAIALVKHDNEYRLKEEGLFLSDRCFCDN